MKRKIWPILALLFVLAVACFFRLYKLGSIPPGIFPDEAINANNGLTAIWTNNFKIFYPYNFGREGLFMNLIGISFYLFGISIVSMKIVSATIGILTVLGIYLLSKELFSYLNKNHSEKIAIFSSLLTALSFWHINFSRISFRAIMVPFVLAFSFFFLFRGFRRKKALDFILSGAFLGLGFHTYISARLAPMIFIPAFFIFFLISIRGKELKKFFLNSFYFFASALLVSLPLFIYFYNNPKDFTGRASNVSVLTQQEPIKTFFESLIRHLGAFNFVGDFNWRHNYSSAPLLFWPVGIFFIVGIVVAVRKLIKSLREKNLLKLNIYLLLFVWFSVMILPGALTYEGIPHALRIIGTIPVVFIFAGLGLFSSYELLKEKCSKFIPERINRILSLSLLILFFLFVGSLTYYRYFIEWGNKPEVKASFAIDYVEIGNYLNSVPLGTTRYVIVDRDGEGNIPVDDMPMSAQTPVFIEKTRRGKEISTYVWQNQIDKMQIEKNGIIVPLKNTEELKQELIKRFPNLKEIQKTNFVAYEINNI